MQQTMKKHIIILACKSALGDTENVDTMDYFDSTRFPWISLIAPKLIKIGYTITYLNWLDFDNKDVIDWDTTGNTKYFALVTAITDYFLYKQRFDEFLSVMKILHKMNIVLIQNHIDFISWNSNKTYLSNLNNANRMDSVIIPCNDQNNIKNEPDEWYLSCFKNAMKKLNNINLGRNIVVKGIRDIGGYSLKIFDFTGGSFGFVGPKVKLITDDKNGLILRTEMMRFKPIINHIKLLCANNNGCIIQYFYPEISQYGEFSFVFYGNEYSHAFLKFCENPVLNPTAVNINYGGKWYFIDYLSPKSEINIKNTIQTIQKDCRHNLNLQLVLKNIYSAKKQCIDLFNKQLKRIFSNESLEYPLLYLRIDGFVCSDTNTFKIVELEGIEPYMGLDILPPNEQKIALSKYISAIDKKHQQWMTNNESAKKGLVANAKL